MRSADLWEDEAVRRVINEPTRGAMFSASVDTQARRVALRAGLTIAPAGRLLIIAPPKRHPHWASWVSQHAPHTPLRRIDDTELGDRSNSDMIRGDRGYFIADLQHLTERNFEYGLISSGDDRVSYSRDSAGRLRVNQDGTHFLEVMRTARATYPPMPQLDVTILDGVSALVNQSLNLRVAYTLKSAWRIGLGFDFSGGRFYGSYSAARWVWHDTMTPEGDDVIPVSTHQWRRKYTAGRPCCVLCLEEVPPPSLWCPSCGAPKSKPATRIMNVEKQPNEFKTTLPLYLDTFAAMENLDALRDQLTGRESSGLMDYRHPGDQPFGVSHEGAEFYVAALMRYMGDVNAEVTRYSTDGGVDVVSERHVAQVKNYSGSVAVTDIRALFGVAVAANKTPLLFTSGSVTRDGLAFANSVDMPLVHYDVYRGRVEGINDPGAKIVEHGLGAG